MGLPPGPHVLYVLILATRTSLGRSVRTAYLQRTVATQVEIAVDGGWGGWLKRLRVRVGVGARVGSL